MRQNYDNLFEVRLILPSSLPDYALKIKSWKAILSRPIYQGGGGGTISMPGVWEEEFGIIMKPGIDLV